MRVDLHIHTTASDGRWPPERVISEAVTRGIGLVAVADHDTIAAVKRCAELAAEAGVQLLSGVEVSSRLEGRLFHILGYGFDLDDPGLIRLLDENTAKLNRADDEVVEGLVAGGLDIDLAEYAAYQYDRTRGGWKALNFLIDRGFCADVQDYLERVWRDRAVPPFVPPSQVVETIRRAGGAAVVAHPRAAMEAMCLSEKLLKSFLEWGIAGLECYHPGHDELETALCLEWCNREQLFVTGGSDCHGGLVGREMGVPAITLADLRLGELERCLRM
jgi:predicted metal-dependent phosphoesterase TrpH